METTFSKADKAALAIKKIKVEKLNSFYLYHKEILDEWSRLQNEVSVAEMNFLTANLNSLYDKFPPPKRKASK